MITLLLLFGLEFSFAQNDCIPTPANPCFNAGGGGDSGSGNGGNLGGGGTGGSGPVGGSGSSGGNSGTGNAGTGGTSGSPDTQTTSNTDNSCHGKTHDQCKRPCRWRNTYSSGSADSTGGFCVTEEQHKSLARIFSPEGSADSQSAVDGCIPGDLQCLDREIAALSKLYEDNGGSVEAMNGNLEREGTRYKGLRFKTVPALITLLGTAGAVADNPKCMAPKYPGLMLMGGATATFAVGMTQGLKKIEQTLQKLRDEMKGAEGKDKILTSHEGLIRLAQTYEELGKQYEKRRVWFSVAAGLFAAATITDSLIAVIPKMNPANCICNLGGLSWKKGAMGEKLLGKILLPAAGAGAGLLHSTGSQDSRTAQNSAYYGAVTATFTSALVSKNVLQKVIGNCVGRAVVSGVNTGLSFHLVTSSAVQRDVANVRARNLRKMAAIAQQKLQGTGEGDGTTYDLNQYDDYKAPDPFNYNMALTAEDMCSVGGVPESCSQCLSGQKCSLIPKASGFQLPTLPVGSNVMGVLSDFAKAGVKSNGFGSGMLISPQPNVKGAIKAAAKIQSALKEKNPKMFGKEATDPILNTIAKANYDAMRSLRKSGIDPKSLAGKLLGTATLSKKKDKKGSSPELAKQKKEQSKTTTEEQGIDLSGLMDDLDSQASASSPQESTAPEIEEVEFAEADIRKGSEHSVFRHITNAYQKYGWRRIFPGE